jgi:imidazolonepropionase-like amidohydrolase
MQRTSGRLGPAGVPDGYLIRDVAVIDVEEGRVVRGQSVTIVGDRIQRIGLGVENRSLEEIDGRGLYLVPGFFDAHVHLTASHDTFGPMLVANGVTCVRDTGAPTDVILKLRSEARAADSMLPDIACTGAIIDGDPPVWPFSEPCDEPEDARAAVRKLVGAGVDQIKVYSLLSRDVYLAAVEEAHAAGLKVAGHVPVAITLEEAMEAGQDCCEHLTGFERMIARLAGWQPPGDAKSPFVWFGAWSAYSSVPHQHLRSVLRPVGASGMHHCPTLVVMQGLGRVADREEADRDPRMDYVPAALRAFWRRPEYEEMARQAVAAVGAMKSIVQELHHMGAPLMIGTDLANPYVFAGFAVHEEMRLFQEAGIPPDDVLRAATIVPARFCGLGKALGTVQEGKVASLVLLRGNPLDDVSNASRIEGVFLRGRWLDRAALDTLLDDVRNGAAASLPRAESVPLTLPGKVLWSGRYLMRFREFDAGVEDFLITREAEDYHIIAHSQPVGGPQPPSVVNWRVGNDFRFREARWRVLVRGGLEAQYRVEGDTVRAWARRGAKDLPVQTMQLPPDALLTGPSYAVEFAALGAAGLQVGQCRTFQSVAFGSPSWELQVAPYTVTRLDDASLTVAARDVRVRVYRTELVTEWGRFQGQTWTDDNGLLLRSVLNIPFGTLTARLEGVPE